MINVQSTNYNPAFRADVTLSPNAKRFLARQPYVAKEEVLKQVESLKAKGDKNLSFFIDLYRKASDFYATHLSVLSLENVNGKFVKTGEAEVALYNPMDKFNLEKLGNSAMEKAGENQTYPADMFAF